MFGQKLGCLEEDDRPDDPGFACMGLDERRDHPGASLVQYGPKPMRQVGNSCVGAALSGALAIVEDRFGVAGNSVPSSLAPYAYARLANAQSLLIDRGCHPGVAVRILCELGLPDEVDFPTNRINVRRRPGRIAMQRGHGRKGGKYAAIHGNGRSVQVMTALDNGYPVVFSTRVDKPFKRLRGHAVVTTPAGDTVGRHMMVAVAYRRNNGRLEFQWRNSWGTGWGDGGYTWVTREYMEWHETRNLFVIYGYPKLLNAAERGRE
jgi:hypothetical protein